MLSHTSIRASLAALLLLLLTLVVPVTAQVNWQPVTPPNVSAASKDWYVEREPIRYAGDLYYPAGARVYFDGYRMIPAGDYDGVPIYADTMVEPYSVILIPVGSGSMQPYERLRAGALAGTTGSATPHFPVEATGSPWEPQATTGLLPREPGAGRARATQGYAQEPYVAPQAAAGDEPPARQQAEGALESVRRPAKTIGIWISYDGRRWRSAGEAIRLAESDLRVVGEYRGFPVFARQGNTRVIYLPGSDGVVAPFERFE